MSQVKFEQEAAGGGGGAGGGAGWGGGAALPEWGLVLERGEQNLREYLQRGVTRFLARIAITVEVLEVVAAAHKNGVVVVDLKLDNLVRFTREGHSQVKGIDLDGAERWGVGLHWPSTLRSATPATVAPELEGRLPPANPGSPPLPPLQVHTAADIWSLGVVMFEIVMKEGFWYRCFGVMDDSSEGVRSLLRQLNAPQVSLKLYPQIGRSRGKAPRSPLLPLHRGRRCWTRD